MASKRGLTRPVSDRSRLAEGDKTSAAADSSRATDGPASGAVVQQSLAQGEGFFHCGPEAFLPWRQQQSAFLVRQHCFWQESAEEAVAKGASHCKHSKSASAEESQPRSQRFCLSRQKTGVASPTRTTTFTLILRQAGYRSRVKVSKVLQNFRPDSRASNCSRLAEVDRGLWGSTRGKLGGNARTG
jgi:hypothetical protein